VTTLPTSKYKVCKGPTAGQPADDKPCVPSEAQSRFPHSGLRGLLVGATAVLADLIVRSRAD
jgi:hypothetical protein